MYPYKELQRICLKKNSENKLWLSPVQHTAHNINSAPSGSVQSCLQQYYRFSLEKSEGTHHLKITTEVFIHFPPF